MHSSKRYRKVRDFGRCKGIEKPLRSRRGSVISLDLWNKLLSRARQQAVAARCLLQLLAAAALLLAPCLAAQRQSVVPRAWDTQALSDWATPLAHDGIREGFFSEKEYYESPVDNYRTYPVYDPDREPPGYWESLKRRKPEPFIDTEHIGPSFDWVAAGKILWQGLDVPAMRRYDAESIALARSSKYVRENEHRLELRPDGTKHESAV